MFVEYIYMNSTIPKRHAETLRNLNISFQLKKQNIYQNGINNLDINAKNVSRIERHAFHMAIQVSFMNNVIH